jgi:outer membrane lipoprotein carrier protein
MRRLGFVLLMLISEAGLTSNALMDFSNSMYSFSADFTQTVYDSDSVVLQENKGQVRLLRPGKFRWTYSEPFKQVIVADGLTLWVYDEDIAQVTMRPQADTLGSAPIGLLSGQRAIQTEFDIVELGVRDGLQWFQLNPLVRDTDFQQVYIALDGDGLRAMELRDSFEQATQIRFTNFRKNVAIEADAFVFTPPAGVDVVGEAGVAAEPDNVAAEPDTATDELPVAETLELGTTESGGVETPAAPVAAEDVLQTNDEALLAETSDDVSSVNDEQDEESASESEVTFEVIETTEVPAE